MVPASGVTGKGGGQGHSEAIVPGWRRYRRRKKEGKKAKQEREEGKEEREEEKEEREEE